MLKQLLLLLTLATFVSGTSVHSAPNTPSSPPPKKVLAYYVEYYESDKNSYRSLTSYSDILTDISLVAFNATANGDLTGTPSAQGLKAAHDRSVQTFLLVANHGENLFDKDLVHTLLNNPVAVNRLIRQLVSQVAKTNATGVNLDFENIPAADRKTYSKLVATLADKLHQSGKQLIVSVPAKTADNPKEFWTYAYDYKTLAAKSDYLQLMTYDEYGPWMEAGPVASYSWVEKVLQHAVSTAPAGKLLMGIPAYGYEWSKEGNRAVPYRAVSALVQKEKATIQWSKAYQSPYVTYQKNGVAHTLWFENEKSLKAKRKLAESYKLAGYGVWRLGFEDSSFWKALVR